MGTTHVGRHRYPAPGRDSLWRLFIRSAGCDDGQACRQPLASRRDEIAHFPAGFAGHSPKDMFRRHRHIMRSASPV